MYNAVTAEPPAFLDPHCSLQGVHSKRICLVVIFLQWSPHNQSYRNTLFGPSLTSHTLTAPIPLVHRSGSRSIIMLLFLQLSFCRFGEEFLSSVLPSFFGGGPPFRVNPTILHFLGLVWVQMNIHHSCAVHSMRLPPRHAPPQLSVPGLRLCLHDGAFGCAVA